MKTYLCFHPFEISLEISIKFASWRFWAVIKFKAFVTEHTVTPCAFLYNVVSLAVCFVTFLTVGEVVCTTIFTISRAAHLTKHEKIIFVNVAAILTKRHHYSPRFGLSLLSAQSGTKSSILVGSHSFSSILRPLFFIST